MLTVTSSYDEALQRFHHTGPEFNGWLSNHGPMVGEVLARRGAEDRILAWTDRYLRRLDELPRGRWPIAPDEWRDVLGDPTRSSDWIEFMRRELRERAWRDVLATWWPRLLPGIAAGATHGVIRTGHAVHALSQLESEPRLDELAHALGYWAARWLPVPLVEPSGRATPAERVSAIPTVAEQCCGIRARLAQLPTTPGWPADAAVRPPGADLPAALYAVIDAVVAMYPRYAHGSPTMLIHAATAPNAVAMTLPSLPAELWRESYDAAWTASAVVIAAYRPSGAAPAGSTPRLDDVWSDALAHGGEHIIKFTDTALCSFARTHDPIGLTATRTALNLDA